MTGFVIPSRSADPLAAERGQRQQQSLHRSTFEREAEALIAELRDNYVTISTLGSAPDRLWDNLSLLAERHLAPFLPGRSPKPRWSSDAEFEAFVAEVRRARARLAESVF